MKYSSPAYSKFILIPNCEQWHNFFFSKAARVLFKYIVVTVAYDSIYIFWILSSGKISNTYWLLTVTWEIMLVLLLVSYTNVFVSYF